jgi:hypothetical protein
VLVCNVLNTGRVIVSCQYIFMCLDIRCFNVLKFKKFKHTHLKYMIYLTRHEKYIHIYTYLLRIGTHISHINSKKNYKIIKNLEQSEKYE